MDLNLKSNYSCFKGEYYENKTLRELKIKFKKLNNSLVS